MFHVKPFLFTMMFDWQETSSLSNSFSKFSLSPEFWLAATVQPPELNGHVNWIFFKLTVTASETTVNDVDANAETVKIKSVPGSMELKSWVKTTWHLSVVLSPGQTWPSVTECTENVSVSVCRYLSGWNSLNQPQWVWYSLLFYKASKHLPVI